MPKDKRCAASGYDADHVGLSLAGGLLRRGLMLASLTSMVLFFFQVLLFASYFASFSPPTYSCSFPVSPTL